MKENLKFQLNRYLVLAGLPIAFSEVANAEVIHTTVNYNGGYETYDIDIDQDGTADFILDANKTTYPVSFSSQQIDVKIGGANITGQLAANKFFGAQGTVSLYGYSFPYNYALGLNQGILINSTSPYSFYSSAVLAGKVEAKASYMGFPITIAQQSFGQFGDGDELFVAVKFEKVDTGNIHFGWLRFKDVKANGSKWTLVDMAYNDKPEGQISTGVTLNIEEKSIDYNILVGSESILIETDTYNSQLHILNSIGQEVFNTNLSSSKLVIENKFSSGIYFFVISNSKGKAITRKIML